MQICSNCCWIYGVQYHLFFMSCAIPITIQKRRYFKDANDAPTFMNCSMNILITELIWPSMTTIIVIYGFHDLGTSDSTKYEIGKSVVLTKKRFSIEIDPILCWNIWFCWKILFDIWDYSKWTSNINKCSSIFYTKDIKVYQWYAFPNTNILWVKWSLLGMIRLALLLASSEFLKTKGLGWKFLSYGRGLIYEIWN